LSDPISLPEPADSAGSVRAGAGAACQSVEWAVPGVGPSWRDPAGPVGPVPVEVPAALAELVAAVRQLRGDTVSAVTAADRAGWLVGLRELVDAAEVAFTDVLARFDAHRDGHILTGAGSTAAWLGQSLRLAGGDAASRVATARSADALAGPLDAVAAGTLRFEHARAITKALRPLLARRPVPPSACSPSWPPSPPRPRSPPPGARSATPSTPTGRSALPTSSSTAVTWPCPRCWTA
jgi:hypothetical protein